MNKFSFNPKMVKCNGSAYGNIYSAVARHQGKILQMVMNVRQELGLTEIMKLASSNHNVVKGDEFYMGERFNNPKDVTSRLITGIADYLAKQFDNPELIEMRALNVIETISKEDAIILVVDAHRDCASADHWYTFEKVWG